MPEGRPSSWMVRVWERIGAIPKGRVSTYGAIAASLRPPVSARQVVVALRKAPRPLGLPWHRVVAAGGRIALPGEAGYDQRVRLEMEGVPFRGRRVNLALSEHRFAGPRGRKRDTASPGPASA